MSKRYKKLFFICITIVSVLFVSNVIYANRISFDSQIDYSQNELINDYMYVSNRYSLPEDYTHYDFDFTIGDDYEVISENDQYILYLNSEQVVFKVYDKKTGYVWSSALENVLETDANANYASMMFSSFSIQYYKYDAKFGYNINPQTINLRTAKRQNLTTEERDLLDPNTIFYNNTLTSGVRVDYTSIPNGVKLHVNISTIKISFDALVTLTEQGMSVDIPNNSISEQQNKIASIQIMPFLGSTKQGEVPGYMFVPDGSGALIRYKNNENKKVEQFIAKYYGTNYGTTIEIEQPYKAESYDLTAPVFGVVHGVDQNGFIGMIENGSYNADLVVSPNGAANVKYNWITPKFILRDSFLLYRVNETIEEERSKEDITIHYSFLQNDKANYVGMAKAYQDFLVTQNVLHKKESTDVPTRIEILASDSKNGLLGPSVVTMTNVKQAQAIIENLQSQNVNDLVVVMRGWNPGGMSGNSPYQMNYEGNVGSTGDFNQFITELKNQDIPVYFNNDYLIGYDGSVNVRSDVAKSLHRVQLSFDTPLEPVYKKYYYLDPNSSLKFAKEDLDDYARLNISHLALETIGEELFSYYHGSINYNRFDAANIYHELLGQLDNNLNLALYKPNAYMWQYSNQYFDMPLSSSEYTFYSDSVPFLQIVFKGYMDYYAPFTNFYANQAELKLKLIEYGMNPSFIVTNKDSYELKYTNANDFFATNYDDWRDTISEYYNEVNDTLKLVANATIVERTVLKAGIVEVKYSNGISFIVNYTDKDFEHLNIIVEARDYLVMGVN